MEALSFRKVLPLFYKSTYENMMSRWRDNKLGKSQTDKFSMLQVEQFLNLINENKIIQEFLDFDRCYKLADKYLLSMVFVYFLRAKLPLTEYTRTNFFVALYLAHDIEEDDEDLKLCFVNWGLGVSCPKDFDYFISLRNKMWKAMDYRACVSLKSCHQIMKVMPNCSLWKRERDPAHGGAIRDYQSEKCPRCHLIDEDRRFYWSDYEFSNESDSEENNADDQESSSPLTKRLKINEE